jgi:hypothetical protein
MVSPSRTLPARVIATNDRMISSDQEKDTAQRMGAKTLTLPTSHLSMLSQPALVADFVIEAAASFAANAAALGDVPKTAAAQLSFRFKPQVIGPRKLARPLWQSMTSSQRP